MQQLSPTGHKLVADLANRHGFSVEAVSSMLESLLEGNGQMAQFNHPEFAGSGQWMRGGMTMISDLFNHGLKARVDALCGELSNLVASEPALVRSGSFQSQSQGSSGAANLGGSREQRNTLGAASLFIAPAPGASANWWPAELTGPSSTGVQNNARYAYFPQARRLAIEVDGSVTVYDTLDHRISAFSQQQSVGGSLSFSSQHGLIDVASLPLVAPRAAASGAQGTAPKGVAPADAAPKDRAPADAAAKDLAPADAGTADVFGAIEKLAGLRAKGILTDEEFAAKKAELLKRI